MHKNRLKYGIKFMRRLREMNRLTVDLIIRYENEFIEENKLTSKDSTMEYFVRDCMVELKQLRRSQMQPAVKYLGNDVMKQFRHMYSELVEISNEMWDVCKLIEEIIDLQFSCQTMLEGPLGLSKSQIADYVQMVVKKNADRGYDKK
jgi:hypothetical protein